MPYQQSILHSRVGKFSAMKMCHEQHILSHQIRTSPPYCLRSTPQYATRVASSVSRHQTNFCILQFSHLQPLIMHVNVNPTE